MSAKKPSNKSQEQANKIAKGIQRPKQSKEQTKLIAQGIQKGIELYKKQHKEKLRQQDKQKKKKKITPPQQPTIEVVTQSKLAWGLLIISNSLWLMAIGGFLIFRQM